MLSADIERRDVLKTAGIAGIAAITGIPLSPTLAAVARMQSDGLAALAARVQMRGNGGADIEIALSTRSEGWRVRWNSPLSHGDNSQDGTGQYSWARRARACDTARALLMTFAADMWGVAPAECRLQAGRITHEKSGRTVAYLIWTDFG